MINKYFLAKMNIPAYLKKFLYNRYNGYIGGVPPILFEANGQNLKDYIIYGNSGGVGDRTKNLFDYSTVTTGYRITWTTGINQADPSAIMSDFIAVSNGIYRTSISVNLIGYDINKNYIGTYNANSKSFKKEYGPKTTYYEIADNNVKFVKLLSYSSTDTISQNTMFSIGSTALPYEPYGYKVPIVISGKNLFNEITYQGAVNNSGNIGDSTKRIRSEYIDVDENETYTCSSNLKIRIIYAYNNEYNKVGCIYDEPLGGKVVTFVMPIGATKIMISFMDAGDPNNEITPNDFLWGQLEKGSIATDYEPYHEPTTTNIYIDEPIGENESISLSDTNTNIPTIRGTNILSFETTVQPSKVLIKV